MTSCATCSTGTRPNLGGDHRSSTAPCSGSTRSPTRSRCSIRSLRAFSDMATPWSHGNAENASTPTPEHVDEPHLREVAPLASYDDLEIVEIGSHAAPAMADSRPIGSGQPQMSASARSSAWKMTSSSAISGARLLRSRPARAVAHPRRRCATSTPCPRSGSSPTSPRAGCFQVKQSSRLAGPLWIASLRSQ